MDLINIDRHRQTRNVSALLGAPYRVENEVWACPVELRGFEPQYPDIQGEGAMQALGLALGFLRQRLGNLLDQGEIFYVLGDEEVLDRALLEVLLGQH